MKTVLLLVFVLAFIHAEGQSSKLEQQRKLPIREGGQTIDAGNIPESIHAKDTTWNQTTGPEKVMPRNNPGGAAGGVEIESRDAVVRKRPGRTKYANMTLKRGSSQESIPVDNNELVAAIASDSKLTKVDAGNALNALFSNLSESLNSGEVLQLIHFGENGSFPDASNARMADLKKLADELVNRMADEAKLTKADAGNALNAFVTNLSNTLRGNSPASSNGTLSRGKVTHKNEFRVAVSKTKALSFSLGDPDDDGDGLLDVRAVETDPQDSDGDGYGDHAAMLVVKIDQTSLRNTSTVMNSETEFLAGKRDARMGIRALRIHDVRHGIRARHHDARVKGARIKTAHSNDERIKTVRSNDARIKTARMNDGRIKNARVDSRTDKRHDGAMKRSSGHIDQHIEIVTDKDFKVAPQTDIDAKYVRIKNHQTAQISKGPLQLIAPLLSVQNANDPVAYAWTVTNKEQNMEQSFSGNSINYDFSKDGTYEIKITPTLNDRKLCPYQVLFVVK